jgi:hypothetical protein
LLLAAICNQRLIDNLFVAAEDVEDGI